MSYHVFLIWPKMILGDRDLKYYLEKGLVKIDPFSEELVRENGIDLTIGSRFARLKKTYEVFEPIENVEKL